MFNHPLAQNNEQYEGYTVFTLEFNGMTIKFMTLVDVKEIIEKKKKSQVFPQTEG